MSIYLRGWSQEKLEEYTTEAIHKSFKCLMTPDATFHPSMIARMRGKTIHEGLKHVFVRWFHEINLPHPPMDKFIELYGKEFGSHLYDYQTLHAQLLTFLTTYGFVRRSEPKINQYLVSTAKHKIMLMRMTPKLEKSITHKIKTELKKLNSAIKIDKVDFGWNCGNPHNNMVLTIRMLDCETGDLMPPSYAQYTNDFKFIGFDKISFFTNDLFAVCRDLFERTRCLENFTTEYFND